MKDGARRLRRTEPLRTVFANMNSNDDVACSICGAEHDKERSPELDSTHLCPDCAVMQRRARRAPRVSFLLSVEGESERAAE